MHICWSTGYPRWPPLHGIHIWKWKFICSETVNLIEPNLYINKPVQNFIKFLCIGHSRLLPIHVQGKYIIEHGENILKLLWSETTAPFDRYKCTYGACNLVGMSFGCFFEKHPHAGFRNCKRAQKISAAAPSRVMASR